MIQQASFDEFVYSVDMSRNVASKHKACDKPQESKLNMGADENYQSMPVSSGQ